MKDTAGSSGRDFAKLRVIFLTRNLYYIVYMGVLFSSSRMVFWRVGASFDCNQSLNKFELSSLSYGGAAERAIRTLLAYWLRHPQPIGHACLGSD